MTGLRSITRRAVQVFTGQEPPEPPTGRGREFLFVRGHPRSGTNWMSRLLNLHPKVFCTGEFQFEQTAAVIRRLQAAPWQICSREPVRTALDESFRDMVRRCVVAACREKRPEAVWFGDRSPTVMHDLLPGARYLWVLRDGRDVVVSWTFHQLRRGPEVIRRTFSPHDAAWLLATTDRFQAEPQMFEEHPELLLSDETWVRRAAAGWAERYRADRAAADEIAVSSDEDQPRLLEVRYERVHADPEGERAAMYRFLGLEPDEAEPLSAESRTLAGYTKNDPTKFLRKGEVGDWRNYFTDQATEWFREVAGETLIHAGYEKDNSW